MDTYIVTLYLTGQEADAIALTLSAAGMDEHAAMVWDAMTDWWRGDNAPRPSH